MLQTARHAPPAPPDPAELAGLCATLRTLSETAGREALGDDGWAEMADRICELAAIERGRSFAWTMRAAELAAARAEGFEAGQASAAAGRHRVPRQHPLWPRAVPGLIPLGPVAAKIAAAVTTAAAAVGLGAAVTHQLGAAPHASSWHAPSGSAAASLAPTAAVPVITLPPATGRHARLDADSARPLAVTVAPSWPLSRPVPSSSPRPSPSAVTAGTLDVAQVRLAIGPSGTAELDVTAVGGPVKWSAASDSPEVTLTAAGGLAAGGQQISGTLAAGKPTTIEVTVAPESPLGMATITLTGSDGTVQAVPVYWM